MTTPTPKPARPAAPKRVKTHKIAIPAVADVLVDDVVTAESVPEPVAAPVAPVTDEPAEAEKTGHKKKKKKEKKEKKEKKAKKEAVLIRFEDAQLATIDAKAESLGLSRAAWVRMVVAKALAAE